MTNHLCEPLMTSLAFSLYVSIRNEFISFMRNAAHGVLVGKHFLLIHLHSLLDKWLKLSTCLHVFH